jgi:hypothetical protein
MSQLMELSEFVVEKDVEEIRKAETGTSVVPVTPMLFDWKA